MAFRKKMSKGNSKRYFTAAGSKTHKKNMPGKPMRGGIRL